MTLTLTAGRSAAADGDLPATFYRALALGHQRLDVAVADLRLKGGQLGKGEAALKDVRDKLDAAQAVLDGLRDELKNLTTPDGADARFLRDVYEKYLSLQGAVIKDYRDILAANDDASLSAPDRDKRVQLLASDCRQLLQAAPRYAQSDLLTAYARANGVAPVKPVPLPAEPLDRLAGDWTVAMKSPQGLEIPGAFIVEFDGKGTEQPVLHGVATVGTATGPFLLPMGRRPYSYKDGVLSLKAKDGTVVASHPLVWVNADQFEYDDDEGNHFVYTRFKPEDIAPAPQGGGQGKN